MTIFSTNDVSPSTTRSATNASWTAALALATETAVFAFLDAEIVWLACLVVDSSSASRADIRAGKLEGSMRSIGIEPRSGQELVGTMGIKPQMFHRYVVCCRCSSSSSSLLLLSPMCQMDAHS